MTLSFNFSLFIHAQFFLKNMVSKSSYFSALVLFLFLSGICYGETFYVDDLNGIDSNNGMSEEKPFKSLKRVTEINLLPGDKVLFKRGGKWSGNLKIAASGTEKKHITIGSYGDGPKPVIENRIEINNWETDSFGRYSISTGDKYCYGLFQGQNKLKEATDSELSDGKWFFNQDAKKIYFQMDSANKDQCSYAYSHYNLLLKKCEYVTITGLNFNFGTSGIVVDQGQYIDINDCEFENFYERGIALKDIGGYCRLVNNTIQKCGDGIYLIGNCFGNNYISNNIISYCNYNEYNNNDGHAIGIQNCSNNLIINNKISYCIAPIAVWADIGKYANNNTIAYNYITDCNKEYKKSYYGQAIGIVPREAHHATGNLIYYNLIRRCNFGVKFNSANEPSNQVFNNVFDECGVSVMLSKAANYARVVNNIFFRSLKYHILSDHKDVGEQNFFDYNCYFPELKNGYVYRSRVLNSFFEWKNTTENDQHSLLDDPNFVDTENFKLKASSKCIDSGVNISIYIDYYGNTVFQGKAVDIGISEFATSSLDIILPPTNLRLK